MSLCLTSALPHKRKENFHFWFSSFLSRRETRGGRQIAKKNLRAQIWGKNENHHCNCPCFLFDSPKVNLWFLLLVLPLKQNVFRQGRGKNTIFHSKKGKFAVRQPHPGRLTLSPRLNKMQAEERNSADLRPRRCRKSIDRGS